MNYDPNLTGSRIKQVREDLGLSQEEYSERLNISRNHLARIEVGLRVASVDLLITVSEMSNVTIDYLLMGKVQNHAKLKAELSEIVQALSRLEKEL